MTVGMCTCGHRHCRYCWAQPYDWAPTAWQLELQRQQDKLQRRLMKPRYKLHGDGRCEQLPNMAAAALGGWL